MKTIMRGALIITIPAGIAAGLYVTTGLAQDIQISDGGFAARCAEAASGLDTGMPKKVDFIGTRIGIDPVELCTLAISKAENMQNQAASYNNRGVLLFSRGAIGEALNDFNDAIRRNETMPQYYMNRGYALTALRRWDESIRTFDKVIELGTGELAKAHFNRGVAQEELGDARKAYRDYLKASEIDPQYEAPRRELTRFTVTRSPGR